MPAMLGLCIRRNRQQVNKNPILLPPLHLVSMSYGFHLPSPRLGFFPKLAIMRTPAPYHETSRLQPLFSFTTLPRAQVPSLIVGSNHRAPVTPFKPVDDTTSSCFAPRCLQPLMLMQRRTISGPLCMAWRRFISNRWSPAPLRFSSAGDLSTSRATGRRAVF